MVKIDKNKCIGCGVCASICPDGFVIAGRLAQVKDQSADCIAQAAQSCPVGAILVNQKGDKLNLDNQPNSQEINSVEQNDFNQANLGKGRGRGFGFGRRRGHGFGFGRRRGFGFGRRGQE